MDSVGCWLQTIFSHFTSSFYKYSQALCGFEWVYSSAGKSPRQIISPVITSITAATSNLVSQLPKTQPRLVNLSKRVIHPRTKDVLEKGPKFCLSQRITSKIMTSAEVGIERAFYAMKWAAHLEDKRANNNNPADENSSPISDTDSSQASLTFSVPHPRPNFPDSDVQQPPEVGPSAERKLEQLKSKILKLYTHHKVQEKPNVSSSVLMDLRELKQDDGLIIKQSDKCKSFVVMDKEEYLEKATMITNSYEKLQKNPTRDLEDATKNLMKTTLSNKIPQDHLKRLLPQHARTAEFYGLPKTHKPGNPLRPIVAACGDPLDKLSWFLQLILGQLLQFIPTHLPDSDTFLSRLKQTFPTRLPDNCIIFTMDVCNLYGSIPIQEGIDSVMTLIRDNVTKIDMFGLSLTDFHKLLTHVLTNNYLRFGLSYFKQTTGIAMGSRIAPPIAISFMHVFESSFLSSLQFRPDFLVRYIDDYCGIWSHGVEQLKSFFERLNNFHPAIKLTLDHTGGSSEIPFLDILLTVRSNGAYSTELYVKPMTAPIIMNFRSAHPMSVKKGTLKSQIKRAIRLSSDSDAKERSLNKISELFGMNEYPASLIRQTIRYCGRPNQKQPKKRTDQFFMRLPFVDEVLTRRVNAAIRSSKAPIKVSWINKNNLNKLLVSSALSPPPCPSGNKRCHTCDNGLQGHCTTRMTVYKITCLTCQSIGVLATYIGQSRRPIRARFNEHLGDARLRKPDTGLGDHISEHHWEMDNNKINSNFHIEILTTKEHEADLRICESVHIRDQTPSMNTKSRSWNLTKHIV